MPREKPPAGKPYADFPLFFHATGQWAKKIRGKTHYFGTDADKALAKYLSQRDDLQAGRTPRVQGEGFTVRDLCNAFLTVKLAFRDAGELAPRTFQEYYTCCEFLCSVFGRTRLVDDLAPEDFDKLRSTLAATLGPVALGNAIQRVRTVFKHGFDAGLMDRPVRFGPGFRKPSRKAVRKARNESGSRMMEPAELRTIIGEARQPLRAMILLGVNCGFGQTDVAALPRPAIDFAAGWIAFPRPKTEVERRCPLWPETVKALREALADRPAPRHGTDPELVFITKYGRPWVRFDTGKANEKRTVNDSVGREYAKLLKRLGVKRRGSFYNLRHVFRTVADGSKDQPAVDFIMGHSRDDMASRYRERIGDERLQAVADVVRAWLFGRDAT